MITGAEDRVEPSLSAWQIGRLQPMPKRIPDGWELVRLTDVATLESGHTPSRRSPEYWKGNIPWISLHDTDGLDVPEILSTAQTIGELGLANSSARLLPKGTVVFSRTATVGKATVMGRSMATSQDFANYVCGDRVHNHFLVHLFRFLAPEWNRLKAGSTLNTIYMPVFRDLQVLLPPIREQRDIAAALSDVDELIGALKQVISKKRDLKQAVAHQLLMGDTRLPGFSGKWELRKLGGMANFRTGPFGSALHKSDYTNDGIPIVNPMHIVDGRIVPTSTMTITEEAAAKLADFRLRAFDVVIGRRGDMGRCAVVQERQEGWLCGTGSMIVRTSAELFPPFLQRVLSSPRVVAAIEDASVGTTMINLNQGVLAGLNIETPSFAEQTAIATVLSDMDAELAAIELRRDKTQLLKQGMMQELLTGRTRLV